MKEDHKGHSITASVWQIRDTQLWQPQLVIWTERSRHPLKAPNIDKYFRTREQPESEGLVFAKKWIDDGKPSVF